MNYVIVTAKTVDEAVKEALKQLDISRDEAEIEVLQEPSSGFLGIFQKKEARVKVTKSIDAKELIKEIFSEELESKKTDEVENTDEDFDNVSIDLESPVSDEKEDEIEDFKETEELEDLEIVTQIEEIDEIEETENIEESEDSVFEDSVDLEEVAREFLVKVLDAMEVEYSIEVNIDGKDMHVNIDGDEKELGVVIGKRGQTLDSIEYILGLIVNRHSKKYTRVKLDCSGYRDRRKKSLENLALKMADKALKTERPVRLEPMNAYERKIIHEALHDYKGVITHSEGKDPYRRVIIQKEVDY